MEEAVPCNNVVANDDIFSKLILATDALGKKSTFKDVGGNNHVFFISIDQWAPHVTYSVL